MRRVAWVVATASIAVAVSAAPASADDPADSGETGAPVPTTTVAPSGDDAPTPATTVPGTAPTDTAPADAEPEDTVTDPSVTEPVDPDDPATSEPVDDPGDVTTEPPPPEEPERPAPAGADLLARPTCRVNRSLSPGDSNAAVGCLERHLLFRGYRVGNDRANRWFDGVTVSSLRTWMSRQGLRWRGGATPKVLDRMGIWSGYPLAGSCSVNRSVGPGDFNDAVRCVEKRLAQLGYDVGGGAPRGGPSRWFDPASVASLRAWTSSVGLAWRGRATPKVLDRLGIWSGRALTGKCTISQVVRPRDFGPAVLCVEKRLAQLGYEVGGGAPRGGPSRWFDPASVSSLRAYQRSKGLVVDGVAGPQTATKLGIWKPPPTVTPAGSPVFAVGTRQVALTFDDGPSSYTDQVLDVLARFGVPATFFLVGSAVDRGAAALRRTYREGHSVQNHSWDHPSFTRLSDGSIQSQLNRTAAAIQRVTGQRSTCYRPPGGATSSRVRAAAAATGHYPEILWNVNPSDYLRPAPSVLVARSLGLAHGQGLIIGLHDGGGPRGNTVAALPDIIRGLKARGYRFVRLCD